MYDYKNGKLYTFATYAPSQLGNDYQNAKCLGVLSADLAVAVGVDIYSKHALIYPTIPKTNNVPDDPTQYNYVAFLTQSGNRVVLGAPWIDETSISVVGGMIITAVIDSVTPDDVPIIKQILALNNYKSVSVKITATSSTNSVVGA